MNLRANTTSMVHRFDDRVAAASPQTEAIEPPAAPARSPYPAIGLAKTKASNLAPCSSIEPPWRSRHSSRAVSHAAFQRERAPAHPSSGRPRPYILLLAKPNLGPLRLLAHRNGTQGLQGCCPYPRPIAANAAGYVVIPPPEGGRNPASGFYPIFALSVLA